MKEKLYQSMIELSNGKLLRKCFKQLRSRDLVNNLLKAIVRYTKLI